MKEKTKTTRAHKTMYDYEVFRGDFKKRGLFNTLVSSQLLQYSLLQYVVLCQFYLMSHPHHQLCRRQPSSKGKSTRNYSIEGRIYYLCYELNMLTSFCFYHQTFIYSQQIKEQDQDRTRMYNHHSIFMSQKRGN